MELRTVGVHEVDLIEDLFQEVYNREKGLDYWRWCFKNPYGYLNSGMFEDNRLIGYQASHLTKNSACIVSAMTHPARRKEGIYWLVTSDLHDRISLVRDYTFLFSNEMIRPIHIKKEGYQEVYQIKEYRIPFHPDNYFIKPQKDTFFFSSYELWRYRNHPFKKYIFHSNEIRGNRSIFNIYEDRVQIVDYTGSLLNAKDVGMYIAHAHNLNYISFWSQIDYNYPEKHLPTWKQYKILNPLNIDMEDIMKADRTRMGDSDVF